MSNPWKNDNEYWTTLANLYFKKGRFEVAMPEGKEQKEGWVSVDNLFAIHKVTETTLYKLTHLPTGYCVYKFSETPLSVIKLIAIRFLHLIEWNSANPKVLQNRMRSCGVGYLSHLVNDPLKDCEASQPSLETWHKLHNLSHKRLPEKFRLPKRPKTRKDEQRAHWNKVAKKFFKSGEITFIDGEKISALVSNCGRFAIYQNDEGIYKFVLVSTGQKTDVTKTKSHAQVIVYRLQEFVNWNDWGAVRSDKEEMNRLWKVLQKLKEDPYGVYEELGKYSDIPKKMEIG